MITGIHHIGLEVKDLDQALDFYQNMGFITKYRSTYKSIDALFAMVEKGNDRIELWQFNDQNQPLVSYIRHHVALLCDNIEEDIEMFVADGAKVAIPLRGGDPPITRFAYVQDKGNNFIELCET